MQAQTIELRSLSLKFNFADVAQQAEQLSCKQQVVRSRLTVSTKHRRGIQWRDTLAVTQPPQGLCRFDSCPLHQCRTGSSEVERSVVPRREAPTDARSAPEGRAKRVHASAAVARNHLGAPMACSSRVERPVVNREDAGARPAVPANFARGGDSRLEW